MTPLPSLFFFFFFNDTATTEIYTLSLHDALPILERGLSVSGNAASFRYRLSCVARAESDWEQTVALDRKSTRLNSSHGYISYAVFCLKKKKIKKQNTEIIYTQENSHAETSE